MNEDICKMYNDLKDEHFRLVKYVAELLAENDKLKAEIKKLEMSL